MPQNRCPLNRKSLKEIRQVRSPDPEEGYKKLRAYLAARAGSRKAMRGKLVGQVSEQHRVGGV